MLLLLVYYVVYCQVATADSVTLLADARPIPGGYVVPERGNITVTCNSSTDGALFWTVDLQIPDGTATDAASRGLSRDLPNVSSPDTELNANPASFTIHYIAPESNGSSVKCDDGDSVPSNVTIIVEGSPTCPTIQTRVASETLTVSLQKSSMTWLPQRYQVDITSYNDSEVTAFNFTLTSDEPFDVPSLLPDKVYNISVTPCNIVGCNESCDIHSVHIYSPTNGTNGTGGPGVPAQRLPMLEMIFIAIVASLASLVGVLVSIVCSSIPCLWCLARRRKRRKEGRAELGNASQSRPDSTYAELSAFTRSNGENNSHVRANNLPPGTEYAQPEVVRNIKSVKGTPLPGPTWHSAFIRAPGPGSEYATVQDAIPGSAETSSTRISLSHTNSLPFSYSPPPTPGTPSSDGPLFIESDKVQDVGYASLPRSQGSKRIMKVRNTRQNAACADSPTTCSIML